MQYPINCKKECIPNVETCNPITGKCIGLKNRTWKEVKKNPLYQRWLKEGMIKSTDEKSIDKCKTRKIECPKDTICNPSSGRCIKVNGPVYTKIAKEMREEWLKNAPQKIG